MTQNPLERFSNRVKNYVKYRPDYPKAIIGFLESEIDLRRTSKIADIGSGTGISSKLFLENGNVVYGIEPNKKMREAAEQFLSTFDRFQSVNSTAENMTLPDKSVDFVIAAQAFHWFDNNQAKCEFRRVLRNNGYVVLIWNERQLDSSEILRDYERLLIKFGTDYQTIRHDQFTKERLEKSFDCEFRFTTLRNSQTLDWQGFKGRLLSSSYAPSKADGHFEEMMKTAKSLFARHEEKGKIDILYDTNVFYGQI